MLDWILSVRMLRHCLESAAARLLRSAASRCACARFRENTVSPPSDIVTSPDAVLFRFSAGSVAVTGSARLSAVMFFPKNHRLSQE
jgi:hypothetical protein